MVGLVCDSSRLLDVRRNRIQSMHEDRPSDYINEKEISKAIKSKIEFTFKTDKSLISGIKIQVGSLLIDTSVSNKLKRIKQLIIEN